MRKGDPNEIALLQLSFLFYYSQQHIPIKDAGDFVKQNVHFSAFLTKLKISIWIN